MNQVVMTYVVIMTLTGVFQIILAIIGYTNRQVFAGTKTFAWLSLFSAIYAFGHAFELTSSTLDGAMFWVVFQYLGLPFTAPGTLILVLQYVGLDKHLNKVTYFLYYLIPIISVTLVATNSYHHLFYKSVEVTYHQGTPLLDMTIGQWYIVHGSYTSGTLLIGFLFLIRYWLKTKSRQWKQILTLMIGIILPVIASFVYLVGLTPLGIDPVPIVMFFTASLYLWAILSTHMLVVAPIAKDSVFDSMRDGVIVLDLSNQVAEYNSAAFKLFPNLKIGIMIEDVERAGNKISKTLDDFVGKSITREIEYNIQNSISYFQIRVSPIQKRNGQVVGTAIVLQNVTEYKQLQYQLEALAYKDGLTGIFNRSYFLEQSKQKLKEMTDKRETISFILFDIDHFKQINDNFGHFAGDKAIQHTVSVCKNMLEEEMIFGRYGGEEFVLMLPSYTRTDATAFAEVLRRRLDETTLRYNDQDIRVTASFGVTGIDENTRNHSVDQLLKEADHALYKAKRNGRNCVYLEKQNSFVN